MSEELLPLDNTPRTDTLPDFEIFRQYAQKKSEQLPEGLRNEAGSVMQSLIGITKSIVAEVDAGLRRFVLPEPARQLAKHDGAKLGTENIQARVAGRRSRDGDLLAALAVCPNSLEMRLVDCGRYGAHRTGAGATGPGRDSGSDAARDRSREQPQRGSGTATGGAWQRDRKLSTELGALTAAIATGGDVPTLVQAIKERERRREALTAELAELERPRVRPLPPAKQREVLASKLFEWKELLRGQATKARQMLRKLIDGRIVFTPDAKQRRYELVANGTLAQIISGLVCPQTVASPAVIALLMRGSVTRRAA